MNEVLRVIVSAIKSNKWLFIEYFNKKDNELHNFWIDIVDIEPKNKLFYVVLFNINKDQKIIKGHVYLENIKRAKIINNSYSIYDKTELINKIKNNLNEFSWLQFETFDNNILLYLEECNRLDNDPFQKNYAMIEGIDLEVLSKEKVYKLNEEQLKKIYSLIFYNDINLFNNKINDLVISILSIDQDKKKYVVAFKYVKFDPKSNTLKLGKEIIINPTFLIEGIKHSLSNYTELSADEFLAIINKDISEAFEILNEGKKRNELINTRPEMMILQRDVNVDLSRLFIKINKKIEQNRLNLPLKAFFGNITLANNGKRIPNIVLYDKNVNLEQLLVIFNTLKNPVTYVQGPPGTGKTQTIFNVLISSFYKGNTTLISTMNNKPIEGIIEKMKFESSYGSIPFPYLRLGNNKCVAKATKIISFYAKYPFKNYNDVSLEKYIKNNDLANILTNYQKIKVLTDQLEFIESISQKINHKNKRINNRKSMLEKELSSLNKPNSKDIINSLNAISLDKSALDDLYKISSNYLYKLKGEKFAELRQICEIQDDETRVKEFNKWCEFNDNIKKLTSVFPIIFSTNISSNRLGDSEFLFDLVIMDEAGQCDIAKSLIPISKGKSLLMVGDEDQLKPVTILPSSVNDSLRIKYKIATNYDYKEKSILACMKGADKVSLKILLKNHYRCGKKIINFCNRFFYNNQLKLSSILKNGQLKFFDVKNDYKNDRSNAYLGEANGIIEFIKKTNLKDTVIITPFVNQMNLINELLVKNNINDVKASTIHSVQGGEYNTVILSSAISIRTADRTAKWLEEHEEIVNVAVSRAKSNLFVFGDKNAIDKKMKKESAWYELMNYVISDGTYEVVPPIKLNNIIGRSNGSVSEDEFYETICQIVSVKTPLKVVRNKLAKDIFKNDLDLVNSQIEFDEVLYRKSFFNWVPFLVFEFDGGEHYFDNKRIEADLKKKRICEKHNIKLIRFGNDNSKNYEYLKVIIDKYGKDIIEDYEEISLF